MPLPMLFHVFLRLLVLLKKASQLSAPRVLGPKIWSLNHWGKSADQPFLMRAFSSAISLLALVNHSWFFLYRHSYQLLWFTINRWWNITKHHESCWFPTIIICNDYQSPLVVQNEFYQIMFIMNPYQMLLVGDSDPLLLTKRLVTTVIAVITYYN